MSAGSKTLRIIGKNDKRLVLLSSEIHDGFKRWQGLEDRLAGLLKQQDEELSSTAGSPDKVAELQSVITKIEMEQSDILTEIAALPGKNLHDMVAKLQIWANINMPTENEWSQPSDHLVTSALADLEAHASDN